MEEKGYIESVSRVFIINFTKMQRRKTFVVYTNLPTVTHPTSIIISVTYHNNGSRYFIQIHIKDGEMNKLVNNHTKELYKERS